MFSDQSEIPAGSIVYDAAGEKLGTVLENNVEDGYLVVQKGWLFHKDFYVPTDAIGGADEDGVYLRDSKAALDDPQYTSPRVVDGTLATGASDVGTGELRIPVREEELVVDTERHEAGRVRVHKQVVTERKIMNIPLRHEQVTVERVAFNGDAVDAAHAFQETDLDVPLMGEEAVVNKRVKGVEEVHIRKDVVTETEHVNETVRKERVTVDGVDATGEPLVGDRAPDRK